LIGGLFRHKQQTTRKSELVILLRPVVVDSDKTWADEVKKATGSFGKITKLSQASADASKASKNKELQ